MRLQHERVNVAVLAGIILFFVPLALVSCSYMPWHKSEPWYTAYDIDSEDDMVTISSVPSLIKALENENPEVRLEALNALARVGPDAKDAVPVLIAAAADKDEVDAVHQAVANTLEAIALKGAESDDDKDTRKIRLLVQVVRLESRDWMVQREAVNRLVDLGLDAAPALPALIRVIEDQSNWHPHYSEVLRGAVRTLGNIGPDARTANPALISLMNSKDYRVRLEIVKAMGKIGPMKDQAIIETLIRVLNGDPELIDIRNGFARILPSSSEHMAYKGIIYGDPDADVRLEAVVSLGKFGPNAVSAVPALLDASLKDIDYDVRREAVVSLCKIQPDGDNTMLALDKALGDAKASTREAAVLALKNVRPENRETWLPKIISCLDDVAEGVRSGAIKTLAEYEIDNDMVIQALHRVALEDKSLKVKQEATDTLRGFNGK